MHVTSYISECVMYNMYVLFMYAYNMHSHTHKYIMYYILLYYILHITL